MAVPEIFIINRTDSAQTGLLATFGGVGNAVPPQFVAGDVDLQIGVRPVEFDNSGAVFDALESGDRIFVGIGETNAAPTSGDFTLLIGVSTPTATAAIPFNPSAAAMQTAINAAAATEGVGSVTVTRDSSNSFFVKADAVGAYSIGEGANNLSPNSTIQIIIFKAGDGSTRAEFYIILTQSFFVFSELTNASNSVATLTASITQAGSSTANKIYSIETNAQSGTFRISASIGGVQNDCGTVPANASVGAVGAALAGHPSIFYNSATAANVVVTKISQGWQVEFTGTLANLNTPTLTVTANADLAAAKYLFDAFNLASEGIIRYFQTATTDNVDLPFSVAMWRGSEKRTILSITCTVVRGSIQTDTVSTSPSLNLLLSAIGITTVSTGATSTTLTYPATSIIQNYFVTYTGGAGAFAINLPNVTSFSGNFIANVRLALPATPGIVVSIADSLTSATLISYTSDGSGASVFSSFVANPGVVWILNNTHSPA